MYNYTPYYNGAAPDMLNQYKGNYQMPQNLPPTQMSVANRGNEFIWVQGEEGARAYLVGANSTVTLWDSESPTIYLKSADMNGVPSMRILDFTERTLPKAENKCKCGEFVKKEEFDELKNQIEELYKKVNGGEDNESIV